MIRLINESDRERVWELCQDFHASSPYTRFSLDYNKFDEFFTACLLGKDLYLWLVAEKNNQIVGMLAAATSEMPMYSNKITMELAWYVDPSIKFGKLAIGLLKSYQYWSKEIVKADYCQVSDLNKDLTNLYNKLGFTKVESAYLMEN